MDARLGGLIALAGCWTGTAPRDDATYTFRRVNPGAGVTHAFRQTYELAIESGYATLRIITGYATAGYSNAEIDRAAFESRQVSTLHGVLTPRDNGGITIEFVEDSHLTLTWICEKVTTHVAAVGAHLVRTGDCRTEATVQPSKLDALDVLSCREAVDDGPPIRTADRDPERRRDSNRWTFTSPPGVELLFDVCLERSGVLRRVP